MTWELILLLSAFAIGNIGTVYYLIQHLTSPEFISSFTRSGANATTQNILISQSNDEVININVIEAQKTLVDNFKKIQERLDFLEGNSKAMILISKENHENNLREVKEVAKKIENYGKVTVKE
jgi:hypothetical protein